ncbi:MAG TPA: serine hydrolase domain-containing protein, partial [Spirochaetia bacterium]|nr:serine hydrolase domain-containing protein [Spirochaetia bacterium]
MELQERLDAIINSAISDRVFPGIVLLVEQKGIPIVEIVRGKRQVEPTSEAMSADTIFDLASLTKPLATALLILSYLEREGIPMTTRLGDLLPEVAPASRPLTIRSLLLHISGLPAVPGIYTTLGRPVQDPEAGRAILFALEPVVPPETQVLYACTGYLMLGEILRKQTGREIGELYREWISGPLGLEDLLFLPPAGLRPRIAATENCAFRGRWIRGEVHDENSWCMGGQAGNAGLFGSAASIAGLLSLFSNEGAVGGVQLLRPETMKLMTQCATPGMNDRRSFGYITGWEGCPAGPLAPEGSFGHTGFTG